MSTDSPLILYSLHGLLSKNRPLYTSSKRWPEFILIDNRKLNYEENQVCVWVGGGRGEMGSEQVITNNEILFKFLTFLFSPLGVRKLSSVSKA